MVSKILAITCTHCPWMSKEKFTKLAENVAEIRPDIIIHLGDLYDFYSMTKFVRSQNVITPQDEITQGRIQAEEMWKLLLRASPRTKAFQLRGNHSSRIEKRILEKCPELESIISIDHLWKFPKVETIMDQYSPVLINKINFIHGISVKPGAHVKFYQNSTVMGHSHRPWIIFDKVGGGLRFEMSVGHLADETQMPFVYHKQSMTNWNHGFGLIEDKFGISIPQFIAL